jgi:hypothetical protein
VSYSHYLHIQSYKCIRVLCSSGSLCSSSHVRPTVLEEETVIVILEEEDVNDDENSPDGASRNEEMDDEEA